MKYIFMVAEDGTVLFQEGGAGPEPPVNARKVMAAGEVARFLRRSHRHLYRLIRRGWLRPVATFAHQHFFDAEEVRSLRRQKPAGRMASLPRRLASLFPEYEGRSLHPQRDADLILSRILERGDPAALRWARLHFPVWRHKQFLRGPGRRLLSPRALRFWSWLQRVPGAFPPKDWRQSGRELGGIA